MRLCWWGAMLYRKRSFRRNDPSQWSGRYRGWFIFHRRPRDHWNRGWRYQNQLELACFKQRRIRSGRLERQWDTELVGNNAVRWRRGFGSSRHLFRRFVVQPLKWMATRCWDTSCPCVINSLFTTHLSCVKLRLRGLFMGSVLDCDDLIFSLFPIEPDINEWFAVFSRFLLIIHIYHIYHKYTSQKRLTPSRHAVTSLRPCPPVNLYNLILRQNILTTHASGIRSPSTSASGVEPQKPLLSRLIAYWSRKWIFYPPSCQHRLRVFPAPTGSPPLRRTCCRSCVVWRLTSEQFDCRADCHRWRRVPNFFGHSPSSRGRVPVAYGPDRSRQPVCAVSERDLGSLPGRPLVPTRRTSWFAGRVYHQQWGFCVPCKPSNGVLPCSWSLRSQRLTTRNCSRTL